MVRKQFISVENSPNNSSKMYFVLRDILLTKTEKSIIMIPIACGFNGCLCDVLP